MRKVIFGINISLDGCCDHTKFGGGDDAEMHDYFTHLMHDVDLLVYGRKTYELMVPFWPDIAQNNSAPTRALADFATTFDAIPRIVFSHTLDSVEDKKTTLVRTNLQEEILKLKQQPGKNISIGGVDLPSQLMVSGLVDEYHFVIHPVLVGEGARLLAGINLQEVLQLKLVETKVFKSGAVAHRYVK